MNNEYFIYAGQQLSTIENNYFFSPKWPKMIQKKLTRYVVVTIW